MKKNIIYGILLLFSLSCTSYRGTPWSEIPDYEHPIGFKNMYIVDTIRFENPILFWIDLHPFVMEKAAFDSFNGTSEDLFRHDDVFLMCDILPLELPSSYFNDYLIARYPEVEKISTTNRNISRTFHIKDESVAFLLLLVNGRFYNRKFTGLPEPSPVSDKREKFNYYRVVIPLRISERE